MNQMDLNAFATSSQVMKPGCPFMTFLANGPIRCGWLLTGRDQLCFDQVSRVERTVVLPPSSPPPNAQGLVIVDILAQKSTLTTTYCVETVLPKVIKSIRQQRQTVGSGETFLLHNTSVQKAKVTVTYLKEHNIQILTPPPPSQFRHGLLSLLVVPPRQRKVG